MTALAYSPTDAAGRDPSTVEDDPDASRRQRLRGFVFSWVRGTNIDEMAGSGALGRRVGGADRSMDGAAATADLWRRVDQLAEPLPSVVRVCRLLRWRGAERVRNVEERVFDPAIIRLRMARKGWTVGELAQRSGVTLPTVTALLDGEAHDRQVTTVTAWGIEGGWPAICDRYLPALVGRHEAPRIARAQATIRRHWNHVRGVEEAAWRAASEIADHLPAGWLDL